MKKIIFIIFIATTVFSYFSNAQTKIAYFNPDQMLGLMPQKARLDTLIDKYQTDSISSIYNGIVQEYQYKDSILTKTDTSKTSKSVLAQLRNDASVLAYQIQNWQMLSNQAVEAKARQLYAPLYNKIDAALKQVSKEKGYSYVITKDVFIVAPDGDDLLPLVAAKLGVKLPSK